MARSSDSELALALEQSLARERDARERLVRTRVSLADRDGLFAVLERELWQGFEDTAHRWTDRIEELVEEVRDAHRQLGESRAETIARDAQLDALREGAEARLEEVRRDRDDRIAALNAQVAALEMQIVALETRLAGLLRWLPARTVNRARKLPVIGSVIRLRQRGYDAELARRLRR